MSYARKIVIIGGGIAGAAAAEAARKQDPLAQITVLSKDSRLPYYRLRICEILDNPAVAGQLELHPAAWYTEHGITVLLETEAVQINPKNQTIELTAGPAIPYDALILATGSESFVPPIPGIDRPGVYTLWTVADALQVEEALRQAKHALVIGGGMLGLEAAYRISRKGTATTVVEKLPRLLANQLDESGSEIFANHVRECGISVVTSGDIVSIGGIDGFKQSPVSHVRMADGTTIDADFILVSIGVHANTGLAGPAGIATGKRIRTDKTMRTSVAGIYAAGDAADPDDFWYGLWSVSRAQGLIAGTNAAGGDSLFDGTIPPYVINTMDTRVAVLGDKGMLSEPAYKVDVLMDVDSGNYRKLVYREGILCGFILVGDTHDFSKLQKEIGKSPA